ncbi:MAG: aromatic-ring-hydroxylating dioxygenase subunit beta [Hyphomicrobiales bacterium]|nr:aromatic-ring-hydroxylating dioxygenase subunit beta [Hyphomicrobiales bacterium]
MTDTQLLAEVTAFLNHEARLLDAQQWHDWLDLYCGDAVFWAPATRMEGGYTSDPELELNLIYMKGRAGLEDRVFRLGTQLSLASTPLPRTRHFLSLIAIDSASATEVEVFANWQVVWYGELRGQQIRAGSYEYVLRRTDEGLRIARKKILLLESEIDGYFDFYGV